MLKAEIIRKTIIIHAPIRVAWDDLTKPELISQCTQDEEVEVMTDWKLGGPIITKGNLHGLLI